MPMIVDPSAPHITPPTPAVSPDGWLSASVDATYAGVMLGVDYSAPADTAVNWVTNPSTEVDTTGQLAYDPSSAGITWGRVAGSARFGAWRSSVTFGGSGSVLGGYQYVLGRSFTAGETVTVSAYVNLPVAPSEAYILLRNSVSGVVRTLAVPVPAAGSYQRVVGTLTLTTGESFNRCGVIFRMPAGTVWAIDGAMLETGGTAHPYVDGTQPGCVWDGTAHASTSRRVASAIDYGSIRKVRIVRSDPDGGQRPVRSADTAWAIEGVGAAYDHEAPLGVGVVYTATAILADGSLGPVSSVAVMVPEPDPPADVWIKSLDEPGLSARVTVISWPQLQWASRIDSADVAGSPYPATSQDVYAAAASEISIDAEGSQIEKLRRLLKTPGVRLLQTQGANRRPDQFVLFAAPAEAVDTTPDGTRTFTASVQEVERPDTQGQPMRLPGWSWDVVAANYASYDSVSATFATYQQLATNGVLG